MKKLSELIKKAVQKIKALSKAKKIAAIAIALGIIAAIIITISVKAKDDSNYALLFNTKNSTDAKTIIDILKDDDVSTVVKGNAIYVPKDKADKLRLEIAPKLDNSSKGYELFDTQSSWGTTDKEMDIQTQRALQGELEKTIKSYPQIQNAKVLLVLSKDSILTEDPQQASASVALTLNNGYELSTKQVKAIVALVHGAVPSLAEKNVQITDQNLKNLTENLYNTDGSSADADSSSTQEQQNAKSNTESKLQSSVLPMLESIYGTGKVKLKINADLDFNAVQEKKKTYDGNNAIVSKQESSQNSGSGTSSTASDTQSTTDANESSPKYPIVNSNSGDGGSSSNNSTVNYNNGETDTSTVKASGTVKRLTASVLVDKTITDQEQSNIRDMIKDAIGYDETRGDSITVVGMNFDNSAANDVQNASDKAAQQKENEQKMRNYIFIGAGLAGLLILLMLLKTFRKKPKAEKQEEIADENEAEGIDTVIGDNVEPKEPELQFNPIDLEPKDDENSHVEKEIKKYATSKPDQVVDIIKSWLSEDEG